MFDVKNDKHNIDGGFTKITDEDTNDALRKALLYDCVNDDAPQVFVQMSDSPVIRHGKMLPSSFFTLDMCLDLEKRFEIDDLRRN